MRVIVVGGAGTIGAAVVAALRPRHEVTTAGRTRGDLRVDIDDPESIRAFYRAAGRFDALVSAAGEAAWAPLGALTDADFALSVRSKLMGQVNLVRHGMEHVSDGGSFTITSGVLATKPTPGSAAVSMVNAGLNGFGRAAALDMPRRIRVNVVSPPWVAETLERMGRDPSEGLPASAVARAYVRSVEREDNGVVITP